MVQIAEDGEEPLRVVGADLRSDFVPVGVCFPGESEVFEAADALGFDEESLFRAEMLLQEVAFDRFDDGIEADVLALGFALQGEPDPGVSGLRCGDAGAGEGCVGEGFADLGGVVDVVVEEDLLQASEGAALDVAVEVELERALPEVAGAVV